MSAERGAGADGRQEREFGLVVGGVLLALGGWWLYRGKTGPVPSGCVVVGALLMLLGMTFPRVLYWPYRGWMALAGVLGWVMTRVVLGLVYFLMVTPIGAVKRLLGWDPLGRRAAPSDTYWREYPERHRETRHYEKMF